MIEINTLKELWGKLGDIPINDNEEIDEDFLHFKKGTDRYEIWRWFEEQNEDFIIGKLLN